MCVCVCCVCIHVFWLCGCICILVVCMHVWGHTHRGKVECTSCFLPVFTATGHAYSSSSQCISTTFSILFWGLEGKCILIFSANIHRDLFLSGVTGFPTKCPTSPAVIPGPSTAYHLQSPLPSLCPGRKRPSVEAPAATVNHGNTALGFCPLLSCQSSYRNVVSWAATLLSNFNAIDQWGKKKLGGGSGDTFSATM